MADLCSYRNGAAFPLIAARLPGTIVSVLVRKEDESRSPWWPLLRKRIAQHNVRVVAKWYDVLHATRLSQLLGLDAASTEAVVSELVSDKSIFCKIDRPSGTKRVRHGVVVIDSPMSNYRARTALPRRVIRRNVFVSTSPAIS